jgi:formylglycine-generating enzyme required for sulfatase activity
VTWKDAVQFCEWLTQKERAAGLIGPRDRYRLPTDIEWSRAAGLADEKGDTPASRHLENKTHYPWGTQSVPPARSANLDSARMSGGGFIDNFSHTAPVKSSPPGTTHLYDLAGNVAEWCEDAWPPSPGERVIRGSSWLTSASEAMLTSSRQHLSETLARPDVGFRVVLELAQ